MQITDVPLSKGNSGQEGKTSQFKCIAMNPNKTLLTMNHLHVHTFDHDLVQENSSQRTS